MITINVKTKAVSNSREHKPPQYNQFGECSPGYIRGWIPPRYPMPAIPLTYITDTHANCVWVENEQGHIVDCIPSW